MFGLLMLVLADLAVAAPLAPKASPVVVYDASLDGDGLLVWGILGTPPSLGTVVGLLVGTAPATTTRVVSVEHTEIAPDYPNYNVHAPVPAGVRLGVRSVAIILVPPAPRARILPLAQLGPGDRPRGIKRVQLRHAVDVDGDGRVDNLITETCSEGTDVA